MAPAPGVVVALVQVDLVEARVLGHGEGHFAELGVWEVVGHHEFVAEGEFFEVRVFGGSAAFVFQGGLVLSRVFYGV